VLRGSVPRSCEMVGDSHGEEVIVSYDWSSKSYEVDDQHHE